MKDEQTSGTVRVKAWFDKAGTYHLGTLLDLTFLGTYHFCGFEIQKSDYGGGIELKWVKGSTISESETLLGESDEWDGKEYAPMSDIGTADYTLLNFIAKMLDEVSTEGDYIKVKFRDEEQTEKIIKIDVSFKDLLQADRVYVIHRVSLMNGEATLDTKGMLTPAPEVYRW